MVIVRISEVFRHNHADLQSVTPGLAHDWFVNYSTAPRSKRRGFKLEKNSIKGCDRLEKKTSLLPVHTILYCLVPGVLDSRCYTSNLEARPHSDPAHTACTWSHLSSNVQLGIMIWNPTHLNRRGQNGTYVSERSTDMFIPCTYK